VILIAYFVVRYDWNANISLKKKKIAKLKYPEHVIYWGKVFYVIFCTKKCFYDCVDLCFSSCFLWILFLFYIAFMSNNTTSEAINVVVVLILIELNVVLSLWYWTHASVESSLFDRQIITDFIHSSVDFLPCQFYL